jgi:hypothetical protein
MVLVYQHLRKLKNREKRKKWLGKDYQYWLDKIKHYKKEGLSYVIIYSVNELKNII